MALGAKIVEIVAGKLALGRVSSLLPEPKLLAEERWQYRHAQRLSRSSAEKAVDIFRRARIEPRLQDREPVDLSRKAG